MNSEAYFRYRTTGKLWYDPHQGTKHFDPWWALLVTDEGIIDYYRWLLRRAKWMETEPNKLWGPHVSVIKSSKPTDESKWGLYAGREVEFWYSNIIRWDNGKHAWLDVFSPDMSDIRVEMGIWPKCFFHMTLGRLK